MAIPLRIIDKDTMDRFGLDFFTTFPVPYREEDIVHTNTIHQSVLAWELQVEKGSTIELYEVRLGVRPDPGYAHIFRPFTSEKEAMRYVEQYGKELGRPFERVNGLEGLPLEQRIGKYEIIPRMLYVV